MLRNLPAGSLIVGLCLASAAAFGAANEQADLLRSLPMRFEAAPKGSYRYIARGAGYAVALGDRGMLLATGDRALRLTFENADARAKFAGEQQSAAATTYFQGANRRAAAAWNRIKQSDVYPGVDIVYYGKGGNLEYDFELAPGADPSQIAMRFTGADKVSLNTAGEIELTAGSKTVTQKLPVVYQRDAANEISSVAAFYELKDGLVRLHLGKYDTSKQLVIDPSILLTAYLPGTGAEGVAGIARDSKGFIYLVGYTFSSDFALVGDSYNPFLRNGLEDGFVTKLDPFSAGNELIVYSSFIGSSATDEPKTMTVDSRGIVYLAGTTDASDYPTTSGAFTPTFAGGTKRIFLSVLDTTQGTNGLLYSTYFGGTKSDEPTALTVGANGLIYMTGWTTSDDFPVGGAYATTRLGSYDAFISVFDRTMTSFDSLRYSTYWGGSGQDISRSIALAPDGTVYIAGVTYSGDLPTSLGAYRSNYSGVGDAFVSGINIGNNQIAYSTYLGGSDTDQARRVIVQPDGRVAVMGYTFSYNFPITQNAYQPVWGGNADVFFAILNPAAKDASALVYSTFFGGSDGEVGYDMRRDASGRYYFCGYTTSRDFPLLNALSPVSGGGGSDGFVAVLNPAQPPSNALVYSSLITGGGSQSAYGIELDDDGNVIVTGSSTGAVFDAGQAQPVIPSNTNVFLLVFKP